ncbi:phospholipase effector Tle1 domain-containing protein [Pseudomonas sp. NPDC090202]|uniref:phospholipase effector Tle1 domain-containing protein n=1 Tax=unclassified Pseudomonas TaxID=196821 RepID=UPI00382C756C
MRALVRLGDQTTFGFVITATTTWSEDRRAIARTGDLATCSKCKGAFPLIGTASDWTEEHRAFVATGDRVNCGCPNHVAYGSTTQYSRTAAVSAPVRAAPQAPATALASTSVKATAPSVKPSLKSAQQPVAESLLEEEEEEEELEETGITLRLGLFFDGTGDNVQNSQLGAQCRPEELGYKAEDQDAMLKRCRDFQRDPRSSYQRQPTNIARLYELYNDDTYGAAHSAQSQICIRTYAPGVGTQTSSPDVTFPDMALGRGERGIEEQVKFAVKRAVQSIRQLVGNNPAVQIACIKVDLFGFSRGAAAARHCLNDLVRGRTSMLASALSVAKTPLTPNFHWQVGDSLQIGVLGLFDTVAAIGSATDGWDVNDADNGNINLYLAPGCAEKVIHLVAVDERRHNFSLNSVQPEFHDIVLPGAHGDLGGNYPPTVTEQLLLTRSFYSQVDKQLPDEESDAYRQAAAALEHWKQYGLIDPNQPNGRLYIDIHSIRSTESPLRRKNVYAQVRLERQVRGEYGRIPLQIMHALSVKAGAAFRAITHADTELTIPGPLQSIAQKMMGGAELGRAIVLSATEHAMLRAHYLHQSDNWNVYHGMSGALEVHRVDRPTSSGKRARHPNLKRGAQ